MATITNPKGPTFIGCYATTDSTASSYGHAVWVDGDKNPIMEVGYESPEHKVSLDTELLGKALVTELKIRRIELGLTLADLSEASGVAVPVLSRTESGASSPNIETILKMASALGCKLTLCQESNKTKKPTTMKSYNIKTLSELADLIGSWTDDYYPEVVESICEQNGWQTCDDNEWDIASDGKERIEFTEQGDIIIVPID